MKLLGGKSRRDSEASREDGLRGEELQALWWAEDNLPEKLQPGRTEGRPALCQEAQTQGAITCRHSDQDRDKMENPRMTAFLCHQEGYFSHPHTKLR